MAVYEDANGVWWAKIDAGYTKSGGRRRIKRSVKPKGEKGKKAAEVEERKLLRAKNEGTLTIKSTKVKAWADEWLERQASRVRPKTWLGYRTTVSYIIPTIGHKDLDKLTPADVRAVAAKVKADGGNSTTARGHQTVTVKMLRDALAEGHKVPAPVFVVELPKIATNDRDAIPGDDGRALLATAAQLPDGSRWVAALLQGMRQGECLGLTWQCVDLARNTLDVSWQLQALPYAHGCDPKCGRKFGGDCPQRFLQVPDGYEYRILYGAVCLVRPKSKSGKRIIPLVPWMAAALRGWKREAPASPHDLVWPDATGEPRDPDDDRAVWKALQDAAKVALPEGRHWHLHEARHTTATLLLEADVDPQTVIAIMGHASIVTSRGYQHVPQALARQALERVAERLGLPSGETAT
ncbi:tyrosine-type recombinase/integrase [Nakamurella lactea]|uniref:tyrosine-type recombinase/integrase n=1 Tax=Nakamurella lactea TaxID=459515 RepID=UPI0004182710|nr:site-specific integrase [Nakamurella lactea]